MRRIEVAESALHVHCTLMMDSVNNEYKCICRLESSLLEEPAFIDFR